MESVNVFIRDFLAVYFLMVGIYYTSRSLGLYERSRFSYINYGQPGSSTWWHRHLFNIFRAAILIVCAIGVVFDVQAYLGMFPALVNPFLNLTGVFFLLVSLGLISFFHSFMGEEWRSGIDDRKGKLITFGPYARTRNPMFMAIILGQLGFFLTLPCVFTLVCLIVGASVIIRQARQEEIALEKLYGDAYRSYRDRVPRWIPRRLPATEGTNDAESFRNAQQ